ncbi:MAG TPA: ATP-binding protein, partial [Gemmataceae bacterium]|nr:ATP-binding protein [Gemmataceae bacterium]
SFAKMPLPNLRPLAVAPFLKEVLETNPVGDGVQAAIDCPPDLPAALADRDQLRIVLGNLVRNAREAMPKGGRLTLRGRAVDGAVEVTVTDTGIGIPREHLSQVMEPLYSTKARGLGLGLAIARAILDKNQGTLRVASEQGKGSTFIVRLPAAPPEDKPAAPLP